MGGGIWGKLVGQDNGGRLTADRCTIFRNVSGTSGEWLRHAVF